MAKSIDQLIADTGFTPGGAPAATLAPPQRTKDIDQLMADTGYTPGGQSFTNPITKSAASHTGLKYVWGGEDLGTGADCSGFTRQIAKQFGINLPRTANEQFNATERVADPQPGDLVFLKGTQGSKPGATHVGFVAEGGKVIAAGKKRGVAVDDLNSPYWQSRLLGYGRPVGKGTQLDPMNPPGAKAGGWTSSFSQTPAAGVQPQEPGKKLIGKPQVTPPPSKKWTGKFPQGESTTRLKARELAEQLAEEQDWLRTANLGASIMEGGAAPPIDIRQLRQMSALETATKDLSEPPKGVLKGMSREFERGNLIAAEARARSGGENEVASILSQALPGVGRTQEVQEMESARPLSAKWRKAAMKGGFVQAGAGQVGMQAPEMAAGAAASLATAGLGAPVIAALGVGAGVGALGEFNTEATLTFSNTLRDAGAPMTNVKAFEAWIKKNPQRVSQARATAIKRGAAVAGVDTALELLGAGVLGKFLKASKGLTGIRKTAAKVAGGAADLTIQGGGASSSEAAGLIAEGKNPLSPQGITDVLNEAVFGIGMSAATTATQAGTFGLAGINDTARGVTPPPIAPTGVPPALYETPEEVRGLPLEDPIRQQARLTTVLNSRQFGKMAGPFTVEDGADMGTAVVKTPGGMDLTFKMVAPAEVLAKAETVLSDPGTQKAFLDSALGHKAFTPETWAELMQLPREEQARHVAEKLGSWYDPEAKTMNLVDLGLSKGEVSEEFVHALELHGMVKPEEIAAITKWYRKAAKIDASVSDREVLGAAINQRTHEKYMPGTIRRMVQWIRDTWQAVISPSLYRPARKAMDAILGGDAAGREAVKPQAAPPVTVQKPSAPAPEPVQAPPPPREVIPETVPLQGTAEKAVSLAVEQARRSILEPAPSDLRPQIESAIAEYEQGLRERYQAVTEAATPRQRVIATDELNSYEDGRYEQLKARFEALATAPTLAAKRPSNPAPEVAPVVEPAPTAREPWQMTRYEFADANDDTGYWPGWREKTPLALKRELTKWQKLRAEPDITSIDTIDGEIRKLEGWTALSDSHRASVRNALAAGKPVPPEVLADYPDLAPQPAPVAPETPVEATTPPVTPEPAPEAPAANTGEIADSVRRLGEQGYEMRAPSRIRRDPARFQFKGNFDKATGSTQSMKGVKAWNTDLQNVVLVWRDPADPPDADPWVINGHNRVDKAESLGVPELPVKFIDARSAEEARVTGALTNIADSRGTPIDAAKVFRANIFSEAQLEEMGIDLSGNLTRVGRGLAGLSDTLFDLVVNEKMTPGMGAIIGNTLPGDAARQQQLMRAVMKKNPKWKSMSAAKLQGMADVYRLGDTYTVPRKQGELPETGGLPGMDEIVSLGNEMGEILGDLRARLSVSKSLGRLLSKDQARASLASKTGIMVDREYGSQLSEEGKAILSDFNDRWNPDYLADITDAAKQMKSIKTAEGKQEVKDAIFGRIEADLKATYAGGKGAGDAGSEGVRAGEQGARGVPSEPAAGPDTRGAETGQAGAVPGEVTPEPPLFIRKPTKAEKAGGSPRSRGYNSIPDRPGYEKVYKPYGEQGEGYYYQRLPEPPQEQSGALFSTRRDRGPGLFDENPEELWKMRPQPVPDRYMLTRKPTAAMKIGKYERVEEPERTNPYGWVRTDKPLDPAQMAKVGAFEDVAGGAVSKGMRKIDTDTGATYEYAGNGEWRRFGAGGWGWESRIPEAVESKLILDTPNNREALASQGREFIDPDNPPKYQQTLFATRRITPEEDAAYIEAVERGDMNAAQRMVDEAARKAGYGIEALHGTGKVFQEFDRRRMGDVTGAKSARRAFWLTTDEHTARAYSIYAAEEGPILEALRRADNAEKRGDWDGYERALEQAERLDTVAGRNERRSGASVMRLKVAGDFVEIDAGGATPQELANGDIDAGLTAQIEKAARQGKTGVILRNLDDAIGVADRPATHIAVFENSQVKAAAPVTRDDSGRVIPLSERFNKAKNDMRFAVRREGVQQPIPELDIPVTMEAGRKKYGAINADKLDAEDMDGLRNNLVTFFGEREVGQEATGEGALARIDALAIATAAGLTPRKLRNILNKPDAEQNAAEIRAVGMAMLTYRKAMLDATHEYAADPTIENKAKMVANAEHYKAAAFAADANATRASYALAAHKIIAQALKEQKPDVMLLDALMKVQGDVTEAQIAAIGTLDPADWLGHNKMLQDALSLQMRWGDKLHSYAYFNMLSSTTSHTANMQLNLTDYLLNEFVAKPGAAAISKARSKITGEARSNYFLLPRMSYAETVDLIRQAGASARTVLKLGFTEEQARKMELYRTSGFPDIVTKTGKKIVHPLNYATRLLGAEDQFARVFIEGRHLNELILTKAVNNLKAGGQPATAAPVRTEALRIKGELDQHPELLEQAKRYGDEVLKTEKPGEAARKLFEFIDFDIGGGFKPGKVIVPFKNVPLNVARMGAEWSPLALAKLAISGKNLTPAQQNVALARGAIGTAIILGLWDLVNSDDDEGWGLKTQGKPEPGKYLVKGQPWSVQFVRGGRWYPMQQFGSLAPALYAIANAKEGKDRGGSALLDGLQGMYTGLADASFLSGINTLIDVLSEGGQSAAKRMGANVISQMVPASGLQRNIANATDPLNREATSIPERVQSGIPGLRRLIPGRVDALGRDVKNPTGGTAAWARFLGKAPDDDPVVQGLRELDWEPGQTMKRFDFQKKTYQVPGADTRAFLKASGPQVYSALDNLFRNPEYRKMDSDQQRTLVQRIVDRSRTPHKMPIKQKVLQDAGVIRKW